MSFLWCQQTNFLNDLDTYPLRTQAGNSSRGLENANTKYSELPLCANSIRSLKNSAQRIKL